MMSISAILLLAAASGFQSERVLDDFSYADTPAAQAAWRAGGETPPVRMNRSGERPVLEFDAPFASDPDLPRTILDRRLAVDLASAGQFELDAWVSEPSAAGRLSLYFRSGEGWYAAGGGFIKSGWQTLRFSKASFKPEGQPAGWHQIDGVRISIWRGPQRDTTVRLDRLAAVSREIALVVPAAYAHPENGESGTALRAADDLGGMLEELGLGADAIEDAALPQGALGPRRVAILAYNPRLPDEAAIALERFVQQGGKLFVCYSLHPRLADLLGIAETRYYRPGRTGQLAEIRFEAAEIAGLPESVRQSSWNISIPRPEPPGVRVIGSWYDTRGQPTGHAAMVLGDHGAFFSHLVLADDRPGKKRMLAAVLGHLHPPLWNQMARAQLERIGRIGHLDGFASVVEFVRASGVATAVDRLRSSEETAERARAALAGEAYAEAVALAQEARQQLSDAYALAMPSPAVEGRAFWNHSGTGAYPGDWGRTARELSQAGFNMVLPNMLWAGRAHYASDVLPRSTTFDEFGDQIADCVAACKRHGIQVHVWKVNHNLSGAPPTFMDQLRSEGRLQASSSGKEKAWLCPSHPENLRLEVESMLEVARNYDVDGLHFDYIRYPDSDHCYCDGCRKRFEARGGKPVADWPRDCISGARRDAYRQFRRSQITRLVAEVSRKARQIKPGIQISAAVFGAYPDCRDSVGQDWLAWVQSGYLDFVCPMDYTQSDPGFRGLVENQLRLVAGRIPVYPGIGAWRLTPDRVLGQIHLARELGAPGFTLFDLSGESAGSQLPPIAAGAGANPAEPPHANRDE